MIRSVVLTALLGHLFTFVTAQHETDKWYFGNVGDGLDFTGLCEPAVLDNGNFSGFEGCATIADRNTGELLFYTNSQSVIGRNHAQMPNGNLHVPGAAWENTVTQVIITPRPSIDDQFYIFTNQVQGGSQGGQGMRMALVDMNLNNGNGDVVFKDSVIYGQTVSEKVTAIRHANGSDIWVIGHAYPGNEFFAIRLTPQGPQYPPVLSAVGKHYSNSTMDCIGEMKSNPSGDRIAVATSGQPHIELFQFDRSSGSVSVPIVINSPELTSSQNSWLYGVSFSPDGSKLYAGRKNSGGGIPSLIQVDVSSNDSTQIAASYTVISMLDGIYSVQLAPNGKIYTRRAGYHLGAINHPDSAGLACDFDPSAVVFQLVPQAAGAWGFNNNIALVDYPCSESTGLREAVSNFSYRIYPVPTQGMVVVQCEGINETVQLVVRDALGREFQRQLFVGPNTTIHLPFPGVWVLELWNEHACIGHRRVIVE